jgi:ABC-type branched-subunit amino acid transport system substrate-binding protein
VHGRQVEFLYRTYDIVSPDPQRAACQGWAKDDKVFAVVAVHDFWAQPECLTRENRIPLIMSDNTLDDIYRRSDPLLHTLQPSTGRIFRNWVHWAHHRGILTGKRIGLYYGSVPRDAEFVRSTLIAELKKLGYGGQIVSEVTTDNVATGSPQDSVAVQRFRAARVDLAWLLVSAIGQTNFMQQAQAQLYKPTYIESDFFYSTNDTAASTFPPDHFDGSFGMTSMRFGEPSAGMGIPARAAECAANYERRAGRSVDPKGRPAEWMALQQGCDEARLLLAALQRAGRELNQGTFIAALHQVRDEVMGIHGNVTLRPGKLGGVDTQRTLQWRRDCACWKAIGQFEPLWVQ